MNRIDKRMAQLKTSGKKMLSPYMTAGDPEPGITVTLMHAFVKAGADLLELGLPFSDPMAEGPVIQAAMERALAYQMSCDDIFAMVEAFRKEDETTPIVLMGYMNCLEQYGHERFVSAAQKASVDGMIIVDLPPEESHEIDEFWHAAGLHLIYLCSPTTTEERMQLINKQARGYLYYVSLKGVTGSDALDLKTLKQQYLRRKKQVVLPMMVGFGIKTPGAASAIANFADGVIVGAALIEKINLAYHQNKEDSIQAGAAFILSLREAMDKQGIHHDRTR